MIPVHTALWLWTYGRNKNVSFELPYNHDLNRSDAMKQPTKILPKNNHTLLQNTTSYGCKKYTFHQYMIQFYWYFFNTYLQILHVIIFPLSINDAQICNILLTSVGEKTAFSPSWSASSWPADFGKSQMTILAPSRTNLSAVARPRPEAAPVTTPTKP